MQFIQKTMNEHDFSHELKEMIGKLTTIQTTAGSLRGKVQMVMADHVHIIVGGSPFVVRTEQIVWFGQNEAAHV